MKYISEEFKKDFPEHFSNKRSYPNDKILYQYQPLELNYLETIYENALFISNPVNFNDPFDCWGMIDLNKVAKMDDADFSKFVSGFEKEYSPQSLPIKDIINIRKNRPDDVDMWLRSVEVNLNKGAKLAGIACFTSCCENELMWSHYADKHNGICVGFDFSNCNDSYTYAIGPVQYEELVPIEITQIFVDDFSRLKDATAHKLVFTKNLAWHYEKEWRLATSINSRGKKIPLKDSGIKIKEIVFGIKVSHKAALKKKEQFIRNGVMVDFYKIDIETNNAKLTKYKI